MDHALDYLKCRYDIFEDSFVRLVGSAAELSKIGKPDEFDFAVLLPVFANEKVFSLLFREELLMQDEQMIKLFQDLEVSMPDEEVFQKFHNLLNILWCIAMRETMPEGWQFSSDPMCHQYSNSIAATFHLARLSDNFQVDIDVCFWIPISKELLQTAPDYLIQRDYLLEHGIDSDGLVYGMLPKDEGIEYQLNRHRFASSFLEKTLLSQRGAEDGRLICYKFAKCIASSFLPKMKKHNHCNRCWDCIVSSFCLKQIVFYMINYYKSDEMWSEDQIANRVLEVFSILRFALITNGYSVSSFFSPYEVVIAKTEVFCPDDAAVIINHAGSFVMEHGEYEPLPPTVIPCDIPSKENLLTSVSDPVVEKILLRYFSFLETEEWNPVQVLCRLCETLELLREEDPLTRAELAGEWQDMFYNMA